MGFPRKDLHSMKSASIAHLTMGDLKSKEIRYGMFR